MEYNNAIEAYRQKMLKAGYSQNHVDAFIRKKTGVTQSPSETPATPDQPLPPEKKSIGGFVGNVFKSGGKFVKDVATGAANILNPNPEKNTYTQLRQLGLGAAQKLIPGEQEQEASFDGLIDFYKQRYGSMDALKDTVYKDPVGVASDLSLLFAGGAGALKATAKGAELAGATGTASKLSAAANASGRAAIATNPITAVAKGTSDVLKRFGAMLPEKNVIGKLTPKEQQVFKQHLPGVLDTYDSLPGYSNKTKAAYLDDVLSQVDDAKRLVVEGHGLKYPKEVITKQLRAIATDGKFTVEEMSQLKNIANKIDKAYPDALPGEFILKQKIAYGSKAFDQASRVSNKVKTAVYDIYYKALDDLLTPTNTSIEVPPAAARFTSASHLPIREFSALESKLIKTQKVLAKISTRTDVSGLRKLVAEFTGGAIGFAGGGTVGAVVGSAGGNILANKLPVTAIRNYIGNKTRLMKPNNILRGGANAAATASRQRNDQQ